MKYRELVKNVATLLACACPDEYRVIGYQQQSTNANDTEKKNRLVQVFYRSGQFSKSGGRANGAKQHEITIAVELTVSEKAVVDLTTLNDDAATVPQKRGALLALREASEQADNSFDELADLVFTVLMDAQNIDLGAIQI